jgi:hypothetical protein
VALAARGACDLDLGPQPVADPEEVAGLRRTAVVIMIQATLIAAVVTLIAAAVPLR